MIKKLGFVTPLVLLACSQVNTAAQQLRSEGNAEGLAFLATEDELPASFSSKAVKAAEDFLANEKGWQQGLNLDGRYVVIGEAGIPVSPEKPAFQQARYNAFDKALLDAKSKVAKFYALQVAQEIVNNFGETGSSTAKSVVNQDYSNKPSLESEAESRGIVSKVKDLIHAELDKELSEKGIDPKSGKAKEEVERLLELKKDEPNVDSYDQFRKTIERAAQAEVGSLVVSKYFEDSGNIAIVATYSKASKQLAAAFAGKGQAPSVRKRKGSLQVWANDLTPASLYSAIGVQLTSDENGNLVILSYAQAVAKRETALARKNAIEAAEATADGFIRSFVGESVAYEGNLEIIEAQEEFSGLESVTGRLTQSREQQNTLRAISDSLVLPGITTIKRWETMDKRSGTMIVGVVKACSMATATAADKERMDFQKVSASQGGQGVSGRGDSTSQSDPHEGSSDYGKMGEEHNSDYSHESPESEDF